MAEIEDTGTVIEGMGGKREHDRILYQKIAELIKQNNHSIRDILENFALYSRRYDITRFLAHYELFRMVKDIPGDIVECGVFRGTSLMSFAKFTEIFCMGNKNRKLIGFDSFKGFSKPSSKDGKESDNIKIKGWDSEKFEDELDKLIDVFHDDCFVPVVKRVSLVKGDILETVPQYVKKNPGLRISLLHLDCDLYEPTLTALKFLYPLVLPNGVVVLDEYAMQVWPGESKAVEDYFGPNKIPKMRNFSWISNPTAYFIKRVDDI